MMAAMSIRNLDDRIMELLRVRAARHGRSMEGFDAQIAAICRTRGAALATRNVKDFRETGIDVIDPWSA